MTISQQLKTIGELGYVEVFKNGSIHITAPAINVHTARMSSFARFLDDYVQAHHQFKFRGYFTLYDAWREHAEPSESPNFALLSQRQLRMYCGTGTLGEEGRFIQPYYLKNLFPVFEHPILAFGRHKNDPFVQLIPDSDFIQSAGYIQLKKEIDFHDCEWQCKQPQLFWRGSKHGFPYKAYDPQHKKSQRALLIDWSSQHTVICDAQSSHTSTKQEQLQNKYLLDVDGEVNAWSGLFWKLYSNSVVFKVLSHYEQWYYDRLKPWIHYIPVRGDLSDLQEKFEWALLNDDECRKIAMAGREFATGLTYQQEIQNIQLVHNTKELFEKYAVVNNPTSLPLLTRPPVVVHTYRTVCDTVAQPPGFGDFLRGTVALFQLSRSYQFDLRIDFTHHPLSAHIYRHDRIPIIDKEQIREFFNERNCELEPYLADLAGHREAFVFTHAVPREPVDDECRSFILNRLQPRKDLVAYIKTLRSNFDLNCYCTVHLRMGDHLMEADATLPQFIIDWFKERILPQWGTNVLVVSDNPGVKDEIQKHFGVAISRTKPVHFGQCLSVEETSLGVRDTIAEFLLMAQSNLIYQYSVYPWGSGFSDMCSQLFQVPLEKISVSNCMNSEATTGILKNDFDLGGDVSLKKLHFGCGPRVLKGWINIDIEQQRWEPYEEYYGEFYSPEMRGTEADFLKLDVSSGPLPFEDSSVDLIFHEDFIEHLDQRECIIFLAETFRIMKPGAIQRINTPDLLWSQVNFGELSSGYYGVYQEEWLNWKHKNLLTKDYIKNIAELIGFEVCFQSRDISQSSDIPREFRPGADRDDAGNIFVDLIKPHDGSEKPSMNRLRKKVLNVGGNNKNTSIPSRYKGWDHVLLDLDLSGEPDLHMDAVDMIELEPEQFDAVYCSQNLEHYYRADIDIVLQGMHHVLKVDGFVEISVPDFEKLIKEVYERKLDIDDTLYEVDLGPITVHDFIFGYEFTKDPIGRELCLHKTAFTQKSLEGFLKKNGFPYVYAANESMEIGMVGFKMKPGSFAREAFGIVE